MDATMSQSDAAASASQTVSAIGRALLIESWTPASVDTPPPGVTAWTWASPDRNLRLLLCTGDDGLHADLTGTTTNGVGLALPRFWSLAIAEPTAAQITAVVHASAQPPMLGEWGLVASLADERWVSFSTYDRENLIEFHTARPDGLCSVRWLAADDHGPGGWIIAGVGLHADATDGTPPAIIRALVTGTASSDPPALTRKTER